MHPGWGILHSQPGKEEGLPSLILGLVAHSPLGTHHGPLASCSNVSGVAVFHLKQPPGGALHPRGPPHCGDIPIPGSLAKARVSKTLVLMFPCIHAEDRNPGQVSGAWCFELGKSDIVPSLQIPSWDALLALLPPTAHFWSEETGQVFVVDPRPL